MGKHPPGVLHWQAACILDAEGHFLNTSPSLAAFFHCDASVLRGQSILEHMDPAEATQVAPRLALAAQGEEQAFQTRLHGPGGAPTWMVLRLLPGGAAPDGPLVVACIEPPGT